MDNCYPEPFKNKGDRGEHCLFDCFLLISSRGWREGVKWQSIFLLLFLWKCVQRTILEDDGECVPTICTALPKHCALV